MEENPFFLLFFFLLFSFCFLLPSQIRFRLVFEFIKVRSGPLKYVIHSFIFLLILHAVMITWQSQLMWEEEKGAQKLLISFWVVEVDLHYFKLPKIKPSKNDDCSWRFPQKDPLILTNGSQIQVPGSIPMDFLHEGSLLLMLPLSSSIHILHPAWRKKPTWHSMYAPDKGKSSFSVPLISCLPFFYYWSCLRSTVQLVGS